MDVGLGSFGSDISIHAPRTGSDAAPQHRYLFLTKFQSTLPARGATFDTPPTFTQEAISIHAPRTGSDNGATPSGVLKHPFQSTLPARGATGDFCR